MRVGDFEWDDKKAEANLAKHGVSFPEAMTVLDELAVPLQDTAHPERLVFIGESNLGRVLLIVFTERLARRYAAYHQRATSYKTRAAGL